MTILNIDETDVEDGNDIVTADTAYAQWLAMGKPTYSHKEMMERYS